MSQFQKGKIVKIINGSAIVKLQKQKLECAFRGKLRAQNQTILVGDYVECDVNNLTIEIVCKRENQLLRPPIANVDQVLIVLAPKPKPDFFLVDQVIINSIQNDVKPILILNKKDISDEYFLRDAKEQYGEVVSKIIETSFVDNIGVNKIKKLLKGKTTVLIGQSGVGKSTLLNLICPDVKQEVGELSKKIERGVNTTRSSEIFDVISGGEIIDTPGFSLLSLPNIEPSKLASFYADIEKFTHDCAYSTCDHIRKKAYECGVMRAVENGKLNPKRYARYVELYNMYKIEWAKRYK